VLENKVDLRTVALKLLARREYSSAEFQKKLSQKFPERGEEIKAVRTEFLEKGWLSDQRMAEAFIHDQIAFTQTGPLKIELKLREKGISSEIIKKALEQAFPDSEQQKIVRVLAEQKYAEIKRHGKAKNELEIRQKVQRFLMGKGFGWDEVKGI